MSLRTLLSLIAFQGILISCHAAEKPKLGHLKQNWGHVEVRPGVNIFFWAIFRNNYAKYPMVLWLQGGPGLASSGVGNLLEIGPYDINMKERPYAWTKAVSLLFVDSPAGTGFSHVTNHSLIPKNSMDAAKDLVVLTEKFYDRVADSLSCPLYVFGEGFGAKVASHFVVLLQETIKKKKLEIKLSGLALGDAWLSPSGSVENYARFLYSNSLIDNVGFSPITSQADKVKAAVASGALNNATKHWTKLFLDIQKLTNGVNIYNILNSEAPSNPHSGHHVNRGPYDYMVEPFITELSVWMNTFVKANLSLAQNLTWGNQTHSVWNALQSDMMSPSVLSVEHLLNVTKLPVMVYNGQLDLLVPSMGAEYWSQTMKWPGTPKWVHSKRSPLMSSQNKTIGYYKSFKNFSFYWILRAGHMVPLDAPESAYEMMKKFVGVKH